MNDVIKLLAREHSDMRRLLDLLEREFARFDAGEVPDYMLVQDIINYCLDYPDLCHHPKEDLIYDRMRARGAGSEMSELQREHELLHHLTVELKHAVAQVVQESSMPRDELMSVANRFIERYREHIENEERNFFTLAGDVLTGEDWDSITSQIRDRRDPLYDRAEAVRFKVLRDSILLAV